MDRRSFLRKLGIGAAVAPMIALVPVAQKPSEPSFDDAVANLLAFINNRYERRQTMFANTSQTFMLDVAADTVTIPVYEWGEDKGLRRVV